jgi:tRNA1Val (adenine37-N6)-methyltransferase
MSNSYFEFKKFKIKQDKCAMKVGTDAVLLGAWVNPINAHLILDIGTGTGVIALMMAQKSSALITAIEIDIDSSFQAISNVNESIFKNQVNILHRSFQDFVLNNNNLFDLIITNPPYFVDAYKSHGEARNKARHTDLLSFEELVNGVKKILHPKGKFCLILPTAESLIFKELAIKENLFLTKLLKIKTTAESEVEKRQLMQFEFNETECDERLLIIEGDSHRNYTKEYKELTKDFYLKF